MEDQEQQSPGSAPLSSVVCHSVPDCHFMSAQCPDNYALATQPCMLIKSEQQQFWPSPPLGPWDFERGPCYQDVPAPAGAFSHHYDSMPVSPDSWPSVDTAFLVHERKFGNQQPPDQCEDTVGLCTPTSTSSLPVSTYSELSGLPLSMEPLEVAALSPEEFLIGTPPSTVAPKAGSPPINLNDVPDVHCASARETSVDASTTDAKLDEPYAKLIYRAFMSRPDYAMTLQDIYQWFRDNTTKAVSVKGGWQNSIRHNLSMNAAFTKRHRMEDDREFSSSVEDAKRANEWVLENWAVCYGVQSTTRYRKGNSRRRIGAQPASQNSKRLVQHSAKRAMSGRKGGCAARDSRLRGRAFYHGKPVGRAARYGIEQGCFSPPRSVYPELYSSETMAVSHLDSAARRHALSMHCGYNGPRPHDTPDTMAFPLAMDEHILAQGMCNINEHCGAMTCRGDGMAASYAMPAQGGFLYGIRDVHMGYHGEQHVAEESSSARLFEPIDDGAYDWSDGGD
ncbi:forkhead domain-containing protein [Hirsutella rhossiliensis]|uniref:Forkhead domain-containing protein n=1 Tax=Hirsutella rhossiliensis TaxID=111463 RepID=A0A9P8MW44_9HYPO|nr:forkhead domain-containing protein [Hirsutella rhossiliensis]KAH0962274.1 forkhead domain-containing protein [Hirsutella rhossiliensis]